MLSHIFLALSPSLCCVVFVFVAQHSYHHHHFPFVASFTTIESSSLSFFFSFFYKFCSTFLFASHCVNVFTSLWCFVVSYQDFLFSWKIFCVLSSIVQVTLFFNKFHTIFFFSTSNAYVSKLLTSLQVFLSSTNHSTIFYMVGLSSLTKHSCFLFLIMYFCLLCVDFLWSF